MANSSYFLAHTPHATQHRFLIFKQIATIFGNRFSSAGPNGVLRYKGKTIKQKKNMPDRGHRKVQISTLGYGFWGTQ